MNEWSSKKFFYTIINQHGEVIGQIYDYLKNLESFTLKSEIVVSSLERKGKDNFHVHVHCKKGWKI